jgi:hypothetical protein
MVENFFGLYREEASSERKCLTWALLAPLIGFLLNGDIDTPLTCEYGDRGFENIPADVVGGGLSVTKIGTLEINVDTTRYRDGNQVLSDAEVPFRKIEGLAHLDFDPLYPVDPRKSSYYLGQLNTFISIWIHGHDLVRNTERIGKIFVYLDGQLLKKYDFTDRAAVRALQHSFQSPSQAT